jgi:hypothetical protein
MFSSIINRNTRSLARVELTDEQIHRQAPSVFAASPVAGVSERYTFLPTSQIVDRMRQEGWAPVEVQQQAVRAEGRMGFQKHLLRFQRRDQIAKAGEYAAEIALVNSHDRSSAYQIHAGLWRFVCSNGLMVSDSTLESVSIRHSGQETEEVIAASFAMFSQIDRVADNVARWQARQLSQGEQHDFAARAIALRWEDAAPISPAKILWPRRNEDTGTDLWSVFNRTQENLIQGGQKDYSLRQANGHRFPKTREIRGLDQGIALNKGLWDLATTFAAN